MVKGLKAYIIREESVKVECNANTGFECKQFFFTIVASALIGCFSCFPGGAQWRIEVVDTGAYVAEDGCSLALDTANWPHIAYYGGGGRLNYARFSGDSWHIETVDSTGTAGWLCSLKLDNRNRPHIAYRDMNEGKLKYALYNGTRWYIETVDASGLVRGIPSLAVDSAGRPHVAYFEIETNQVKYAYYDGTEWHIEVIISNIGIAYVSLALDSADQPCIAIGMGELWYAHRNESGWEFQVVDSSGILGEWNSIAIDKHDHIHISYYDWENKDLKYAWYDGINWHCETVDSEGDVGGLTSIAVDGAGHPHISYVAWGEGVKYAYYNGVRWMVEWVEKGGYSYNTSIAIDSAGFPHIAYHFGPWYNSALKYAKRIEPLPTQAIFRVERETGNVLTDGSYYGASFVSGSADVAEWVPVSELVEPGDVLELDPDKPGYYRKARGPCSTLVAGVVSTAPGFVLGSPATRPSTQDSALLALLGIVPVKVTDEGGPIRPGDLLVASSTPGYAMRWDPERGPPCTLVGKALEVFAGGVGTVLALLVR